MVMNAVAPGFVPIIAWDGLHVHQSASNRAVIFLVQPNTVATDQVPLRLTTLDPAREYLLTSGVSNETTRLSGRALLDDVAWTLAPGSSDIVLVDAVWDCVVLVAWG